MNNIMNGIQKIELLDITGAEYQSRKTFADIDTYFRSHGVPTQDNYPHNSKRSYAKDMLARVNDDVLFKIAGELRIDRISHSSDAIKKWRLGSGSPETFYFSFVTRPLLRYRHPIFRGR